MRRQSQLRVRKPQPICAATAKGLTLENVYTVFNIYKPWLFLVVALRGFFILVPHKGF